MVAFVASLLKLPCWLSSGGGREERGRRVREALTCPTACQIGSNGALQRAGTARERSRLVDERGGGNAGAALAHISGNEELAASLSAVAAADVVCRAARRRA